MERNRLILSVGAVVGTSPIHSFVEGFIGVIALREKSVYIRWVI